MKKSLVILLLLATTLPSTSQKLFEDRKQYFKERNLVVIFPSFSLRDSSFFKDIKAKLRKNFKIALDTYWNLSDSVIYEAWNEKGSSVDWYNGIKKYHKGAIFLEYGTSAIPGENLGVWGLLFPDRNRFTNGIGPRPLGNDTTLINIIEEFRFLRLAVMHDDLHNRRKLGAKFVVVRKDYAMNKGEVRLITKLKKKYPDTVVELDKPLFLEALLTRDPRFIYLNRSRLINIEDGTIATID